MVGEILSGLGLDAPAVLKAAQAEPNKTRLKAIGEEARSRGIFGAPTFFTEDGEMFWGNDRLERALAWANGEIVDGQLSVRQSRWSQGGDRPEQAFDGPYRRAVDGSPRFRYKAALRRTLGVVSRGALVGVPLSRSGTVLRIDVSLRR